MQAASAALDTLKSKCQRLVGEALVLFNKLAAARSRGAQLEGALQHSQACLEAQRHRTQRAMRLLLDARSRHDRTIEVLEATFEQANAAAAAESAAKRAAAAALKDRQQHVVQTESLRVQLASVSARATELQGVAVASEARLQVWSSPRFCLLWVIRVLFVLSVQPKLLQ